MKNKVQLIVPLNIVLTAFLFSCSTPNEKDQQIWEDAGIGSIINKINDYPQ